MKDKSNLILFVSIPILIAIIVLTLTVNISESLTELYFSANQTTPKIIENDTIVNITINNLEGAVHTYELQGIAENYRNLRFTNETYFFFQKNITLQNSESMNISVPISIPTNFTRTRVRLLIPKENLNIYFYADTQRNTLSYGNLTVNIECLPSAVQINSTMLSFEASGTNANGWPVFSVLADGLFQKNITIESDNYTNYTTRLDLSRGNHLIDLVFVNDLYLVTNTTNGSQITADRNILIKNIHLGSYAIPNSNQILDYGSNINAVDCIRIARDSGWISSPSAIRFKVVYIG